MVIIPILTGYTLVSTAVPNRGSHCFPLAYTGLFQSRKKRIKIPVKCFYVETGGHSLLIDAGWSEECVSNGKKHLGLALYFASEPVMEKGSSVFEQLKKMGIGEKALDGIYMTHLDCDHVLGVHDFRHLPVFASSDEISYSHEDKLRYGKLSEGLDITPLVFGEDDEAPFGKSLDVFGDGSMVAYLTPTHSKGSVIYKIVG